MIKVMFVCHGNICRSPMAEYVLKDMVKKLGRADEFTIVSSATSTEESGNPIHYGTKQKLKECKFLRITGVLCSFENRTIKNTIT